MAKSSDDIWTFNESHERLNPTSSVINKEMRLGSIMSLPLLRLRHSPVMQSALIILLKFIQANSLSVKFEVLPLLARIVIVFE